MTHSSCRTVRRLLVEPLENRLPCAGVLFDFPAESWHNGSNPPDVNADGRSTPIDLLLVLNVMEQFGPGWVTDIRPGWQAQVGNTREFADGFHPDVNNDGYVSSIDLLQIINGLSGHAADALPEGTVTVVSDEQGAPLRVVFTAPDGRSKEAGISRQDVTLNWLGGNVFVNTSDGLPLVVAKPDVGILAADYSSGDGQATVTRFAADGSEVVENYVCVPGWNELNVPDVLLSQTPALQQVEPDDVRQPIPDFEEVLVAIVQRRSTRADGTTIVHEYEEASAENLSAVTVTLPSGESTTVDFAGEEAKPINLPALEARLLASLRGHRENA